MESINDEGKRDQIFTLLKSASNKKHPVTRRVLTPAQMNGTKQNSMEKRGHGKPEQLTNRRNGNQTRTETVSMVSRDIILQVIKS